MSSFNKIHKRYENIVVPYEYTEIVNGEKKYYEHLRDIYSADIDNLLENINEQSITHVKWMIGEHVNSLEKTVEKIEKLADGDLNDSFLLSDVSNDDSGDS